MKRLLRLAAVLVLVSAASACGRSGEGKFFKPHRPQLSLLANGIEVMSIEDREFPTAQVSLTIRGGSVYDPPGKEGLASLAMQALRLGGAEGRTVESIEEDLEFSGSSLEMSASGEFFNAGFSGLNRDLDRGLDILFDLLRKPAFDPALFEIVRARAKDGLLREQEDPMRLAIREFPSVVYGPEAAWGRKATLASLDRVAREDLLAFHQRFVRPDRILIAASGDFSAQDLVHKISERTLNWKAPVEDLPPVAKVQEAFEPGVVLIPRKGLSQATILAGHLGGKRENSDKFPLLVMNFMLGGSGALTSRLGEEIRSSSGKAYSVWSDFGFGKDYGLFREIAQTSLENTEWVVLKLQEISRKIRQEPEFSAEEIERSRQAILRALVFDFETRFAQVRELARFRLWGYPEDYIEIFQRKIAGVPPEDLRRVARQYLHPEGMKYVIVTDEKSVPTLQNALKGLAGPGGVEIRRIE